MKTQDELVGEQIAAQMIARIDAATARPAETNPAAMTERLIDAAIYADSASGAYVGPARKEVNDARATIEAALEERDALREALGRLDRLFTYPVAAEINPRGYGIRADNADGVEFAVEIIRQALTEKNNG